ncbi:GRF-type domain-containing protein [Heracleum sosnowskyi]|uniref:GRF-type domain-containing protein n=1 Tax=Heracleum sosnowskyi TaxID=360622 RepID=A0AAD8MG48_9APIA|nr:GRF-type domain-containing protein [Heracleum sosnowskyi]
MSAYLNPIARSSGSSSSLHSVKKEEHKNCFCGKRARIYTCWTLKNPGRRFYTCATPKEGHGGCHFFEWFEEDFCPRALDVISHLNHRRIYLEEKLKLVEEELAEHVVKKKALKLEKHELIEEKVKLELDKNRVGKQLKLCVFVVALLVALMIIFK